MKNNTVQHPWVSVVILSYNRCQDLKHTLQQVLLQEYPNYEVIVVDNASSDETQEMLAREFPQVILIALEKNIGIAGWNEGAKIAKGEYLLFLDDDSYPLPQTLTFVVEMGITENTIYALEIRSSQNILISAYLEPHQPVPTFIGCGVFISKGLFIRVGQFHSFLFLYSHEEEFCLRAYEYGATVRYCPGAVIIHVESSVHRKTKNLLKIDTRRAYYLHRNNVFILFHYFPFWTSLGKSIRFSIGHELFAIFHLMGWFVFKGIIAGIILAWQQRGKKQMLRKDVRQFYGNGKYFATFFGDGNFAFRRPGWIPFRPLKI